MISLTCSKHHFSVGTIGPGQDRTIANPKRNLAPSRRMQGTQYGPPTKTEKKAMDTCKACKDRLRNTRSSLKYPLKDSKMSRRLKTPKKQGLQIKSKQYQNRSKTSILENDQGLEPGDSALKVNPKHLRLQCHGGNQISYLVHEHLHF